MKIIKIKKKGRRTGCSAKLEGLIVGMHSLFTAVVLIPWKFCPHPHPREHLIIFQDIFWLSELGASLKSSGWRSEMLLNIFQCGAQLPLSENDLTWHVRSVQVRSPDWSWEREAGSVFYAGGRLWGAWEMLLLIMWWLILHLFGWAVMTSCLAKHQIRCCWKVFFRCN